ncbi:hypothetical protein VNO80_10769 [Phaseolus coccineus]|uniref:Uncharacterized protein n=1 Tax=Phaseolus coccineus TaxID=3886 RepID=A0AAN9NE32_PHACN
MFKVERSKLDVRRVFKCPRTQKSSRGSFSSGHQLKMLNPLNVKNGNCNNNSRKKPRLTITDLLLASNPKNTPSISTQRSRHKKKKAPKKENVVLLPLRKSKTFQVLATSLFDVPISHSRDDLSFYTSFYHFIHVLVNPS